MSADGDLLGEPDEWDRLTDIDLSGLDQKVEPLINKPEWPPIDPKTALEKWGAYGLNETGAWNVEILNQQFAHIENGVLIISPAGLPVGAACRICVDRSGKIVEVYSKERSRDYTELYAEIDIGRDFTQKIRQKDGTNFTYYVYADYSPQEVPKPTFKGIKERSSEWDKLSPEGRKTLLDSLKVYFENVYPAHTRKLESTEELLRSLGRK